MTRTSKYVGMEFGNWKVANIYLAANYNGCTRHNYYHYELERITSDAKCYKKIIVGGPMMTKIRKGLVDIETLAEKRGKKKTNYQFI